jgi:pyruvate kinase
MHNELFDIVATLGPASAGLIRELRDAGANAYRLNASHMGPTEVAQLVMECGRKAPELPVVIDLQGAKMRLGLFEPFSVAAGDHVQFSLTGREGVPLPHRELFDTAGSGDTLSCDDDRLHFKVQTVGAGVLKSIALTAGSLRPRKGVNVLEHPVELAGLSALDCAVIGQTRGDRRISYAFSFMKNGREAVWVRDRAPGASVIGKIERREAAENAAAIAAGVDALWICRGDLGAQLGIAAMARWVSEFSPRDVPCPVLMAGQVIEHMTSHPALTRSEACHVFDLRRRGYKGFVLSDETAIGIDPVRAVRTLRNLLESQPGLKNSPQRR